MRTVRCSTTPGDLTRVGGADGYDEVYAFTAATDPVSRTTGVAVTPKLHDGETIVAVFPRVVLRIKGGEAGLFDSTVGGYPGMNDKTVMFAPKSKKGTMFITSRRIIFIRREIDWKAGYHAYTRGVKAVSAPEGAPARFLGCAGLEFCEILTCDIDGLERSPLGGVLRLRAGNRTFRLRLSRRQLRAAAAIIP